MKRRLLAWFLTFTMVLSLMPMNVQATEVDDSETGSVWYVESVGTPNVRVPYGDTATLAVEVFDAEGVELTYQWYAHDEEGNAVEVEGTTSCTTEAITTRTDYWCVIEDADGTQNSVWFTVSVDTGLTMQIVESDAVTVMEGDATSANAAVAFGSSVELSVNASVEDEEGIITYQWYQYTDEEGNIPIEDAESDSYTVAEVNTRETYICEVTDKYGDYIQAWFYVSVDTGLTVQENTYITVSAGEKATLEVITSVADNIDLTYTWYQSVDGVWEEMENVTGATYETEELYAWSQYYCDVTDVYGTTKTASFEITVDSNWTADAEESEMTVALNDSATMTVRVDAAEGEEFTYKWYKSSDDGDDILLTEDGDVSYTLEAVTESADYYCRVIDAYDNSVDVWFWVGIETDWTANAVGDTDVAVALNGTTTLEVEVDTEENLDFEYQWYQYTDEDGSAEIDGATNPSYTIDCVTQYSRYFCEVKDEYGNSDQVWFYVSIGTVVWNVSAYEDVSTIWVDSGDTATLTVVVEPADTAVTYEWYKVGEEEDTKLDAEGASCNTEAITKYSQYYCIVNDAYGRAEEIWFEVQINTTWTAVAEEQDITVDGGATATLNVVVEPEDEELTYDWYLSGQDEDELLEENGGASYTTGPITGHTTYYCVVTDKDGNMKQISFDVSVAVDWTIMTDSGEEVYVNLNDTTTLTVEVDNPGNEELSYQWYQYSDEAGREVIEGAEVASYETSEVTTRGTYICVVKDQYGNEGEVWFWVYVTRNWTAEADGDEAFAVAMYDTPTLKVVVENENDIPLTYQWYKEVAGEGYAWVDGAEDASYIPEGITEDIHYMCEVTDENGSYQYVTFELTVDEEMEHTHVYGEYMVIKEATCKEPGSKSRVCRGCNEADTEAVPATGKHTYGEYKVTKEASCAEVGIKTRTCTTCGNEEQASVPATGKHIYGEYKVTKEATCAEAGAKTRTCTACGNEEQAVVPATGEHTYGEWTVTKEATCDKAGEQERVCTVCNNKETSAIVATGYVKGETFTKGKYVYKITAQSGKKGSVTCVGSTSKLKLVSIPKTVKAGGITFNVTQVASKAFKGNTKLTSVTIGANVTKIGNEAFSGCKKLNKITIKSTKLKSVGKNAIKGIKTKATIKVPKKQLSKYKKLFKSKTGYKKTMKIKK